MYEFTLLRHAESQGNLDHKHQGQAEFPLTALGRQQAAALATRWRSAGQQFTRIFASPLQRARQTAEIVQQQVPAPLELEPLLAERHLGELTGLSHAEASRRVPPPPFLTPYQGYGNSGEGQWQLFLRAGQLLQQLLSQPAGQYLVVSHRGFLGMLMYAILGITPQANFHGPRFHFQNTGFARFTYNAQNHQWRLFAFNDLGHLGDLPVSSLLVPSHAHEGE